MKIRGVDFSKKYIIFKTSENEYLIHFDYSLRKGIQNVEVLINGTEGNAEIRDAYPSLAKLIKEIWRVYIPLWLKQSIRRRQ